MKKNNTVTIGICALNEEKNIEKLLKSLLRQKSYSVEIGLIVVLCDGSTDRTVRIVRDYAKKYEIIKLIVGSRREGKAYRLNQLYKMSSTDFVVTLDADIKIEDDYIIEKLVSEFRDDVGLVNGNVLPSSPVTFLEKVLVSYENFWKKTIMQLNNGNNINNSLGCLIALSKKYYKTLEIPLDIVAEDHYLYINASENNFRCVFSENAKVYYNVPGNINDYVKQFSRYYSSQERIRKYFSGREEKYYKIPRVYKLKACLHVFATEFPYLTLAILLHLWQRNFVKANMNQIKWDLISSSK